MSDWMTAEAWIEVGRIAHQLEIDHGHNAYAYAEKVASQAELEQDEQSEKFWMAVSAALKPRDA